MHSFNSFRFKKFEDFNPTYLGQSLCMNFDAVLSSFAEYPGKRIKEAKINNLHI